jgi:hypothetical protein
MKKRKVNKNHPFTISMPKMMATITLFGMLFAVLIWIVTGT